MSELFLDGCVLPDDAVLGQPGMGTAIFTSAMRRERSLILATAVGTMERDLQRCLEHARERRQFGQPIGKFQSVASRIVDMKLRLETARLLLYRLAWSLDRGRPVDLDSALVKLHLSESFLQSSLDALQVHGGYGYMAECGLERDVRDAVASRIYSGTSDVQRNIAARAMGL
jgi:alkylation response protein AidB-like acyl-CoA dehydrogenase